MTDPFTDVYNAIWNALENSADFCGVVLPGNRIKFTTDGDVPYKAAVQDGDLPEAMLTPGGGGPFQPGRTSTSASVTQTFRLTLSTGDLRYHKSAGPLKWIVYRALAQAGQTLGTTGLVRRVTFSDSSDLPDDRAMQRGVRGWTVSITITAELWLSRQADLGTV